MVLPDITLDSALTLDFRQELDEMQEGALVSTLATGWRYLWRERISKKQVALFKLRSEIEMEITILREGRYKDVADIMLAMIN